jgi:hypothetical protein
MKGKLLGRRFLTRGSSRCGRTGLMSKAPHGTPVLGALSHRRASKQLLRSTPMRRRVAAWHLIMRTRLWTIAHTIVPSARLARFGRAARPSASSS